MNIAKKKTTRLIIGILIILIGLGAGLLSFMNASAYTTVSTNTSHGIWASDYVLLKLTDSDGNTNVYRFTLTWATAPSSTQYTAYMSAAKKVNVTLTKVSGNGKITVALNASSDNTRTPKSIQSSLSATTYEVIGIPIKLTVPPGEEFKAATYDRPGTNWINVVSARTFSNLNDVGMGAQGNLAGKDHNFFYLISLRHSGLITRAESGKYVRYRGVSQTLTFKKVKQKFAEFDSATGVLRFFEDDKNKYTNGQTSGTKTYYTGFENASLLETVPKWYTVRAQVTTVRFDTTITPMVHTKEWFKDMHNLTTVQNLDRLNTSSVMNMANMFQNCLALTELDLSNFNISSATTVTNMLSNTAALNTIHLGPNVDFKNANGDPAGTNYWKIIEDLNGNPKHGASFTRMKNFSGSHPGVYTRGNLSQFRADENGEATYTFTLKDGESISFDNLPDGVTYEIVETGNPGYKPSFEITENAPFFETQSKIGDRGEDLATGEETLDIDESSLTNGQFNNYNVQYDFTNQYAEAHNLTILKELAGNDVSEEDEFTYTVEFTGLDPDTKYTEELTSDASGNGTAKFKLKGGESKTFEVPTGATYKITEGKSSYDPSYEVTQGDNTTSVDSDSAYAGTRLSSATETMGSENVEYTFTNTKNEYVPVHTLSTQKNAPGIAGKFDFNTTISGLQPNTPYKVLYPEGTTPINLSVNNDIITVTGVSPAAGIPVTLEKTEGANTVRKTFYTDANGQVKNYIGWLEGTSEPEELEGEAYAVMNEDTNTLIFFRDEPGKYTNMASATTPHGTGLVFTGIESLDHISSSGYPYWIGTGLSTSGVTPQYVRFEDKIRPVSTAKWFYKRSAIRGFENLENLDTSKVTDMSYMFMGCSNLNLTSLDLSTFDTSNVTNMTSMFTDCSRMTSLNLESFDTSKVTHMNGMFYGMARMTQLDLSSFDTSNVVNMECMFYASSTNNGNLRNIYVSESWNTDNVTDSFEMFLNQIRLPNHNSAVVDKTKAYYGNGSLGEGYLTYRAVPEKNFTIEALGVKEDAYNGYSKTIQGSVVEYISDANGNLVLDYQLGDGQTISMLGLPEGANYETTEKRNEYKPSFEVTSGAEFVQTASKEGKRTQPLATGEEELKGNTLYEYTNEMPPSDKVISVSKVIKGDLADPEDVFNYTMNFSNLEPDTTYTVTLGREATGGKTQGPDLSSTEAYAVFNSVDGTLTFFRDEPGKYTNKQVLDNGRKIVYTGIETRTATYDVHGDTSNLGAYNFGEDPNGYYAEWFDKRNLITTVNFEDYIRPVSTDCWFEGLTNLTTINNLGKLMTDNVTGMANMFRYASSLTSLDLSTFDTSKVTNIGGIFRGMTSLQTLNLSSFDTSSVTNYAAYYRSDTHASTIYVSDRWTISDYNTWFTNAKQIVPFVDNSSSVKTYTFTTNSSGEGAISFNLKGGETFDVTDLPLGAEYVITEAGKNGYTPSYKVTEGEDQLSSSHGFAAEGASLSTETDIVQDEEDVAYEFTNSKFSRKTLNVKKLLAGTAASMTDVFTVSLQFKDLEPNTTYTVSNGQTITSDSKGEASIDLAVSGDDIVSFTNLPGSCSYVATESASTYIPSYEIMAHENFGAKYGLISVDREPVYDANDELTGYIYKARDWFGEPVSGVSITAGGTTVATNANGEATISSTANASVTYNGTTKLYDNESDTVTFATSQTEGVIDRGSAKAGKELSTDGYTDLETNQTITFTNTKNAVHDLTIAKRVDGSQANENDTFTFNVDFTNLPVGTYNISKYDAEDNETTLSFTNASTTHTYTTTLKDSEYIVLRNIPEEATYSIRENASSYKPSFEVREGTATDMEKEGLANTALSSTPDSLEMDTTYLFTNCKSFPTPTKTVSDTDGITLTGEGTETDVTENTVKNKTTSWTYKITQEIPAGASSFMLGDQLAICVEADDVKMMYNGTDISSRFDIYINDDNSVEAFALDEEMSYLAGKTVTMVIEASIPQDMPEYFFKDYYAPDASRLILPNKAFAVIDDIQVDSNEVKTNVLLHSGLTIRKAITGNSADPDDEFTFSVALTGLAPNATYTYDKPVGGNLAVSLAGNKVVFTATDAHGNVVEGLPVYIYADEDEDNLYGYGETNANGTYSIRADRISKIKYVAGGVTGTLRVDTRASSLTGDITGAISVPGTKTQFTSNGNGTATVTANICGGETLHFIGLPQGTGYRVTESANDYTPSFSVIQGSGTTSTDSGSANANTALSTGTETLAGEPVTIQYSNELDNGELHVTKTVVSPLDSDDEEDFTFTVAFSDTTLNGTFGDITLVNGVGTVTLKHGETADITNIPAGVTYTVTEASAPDFITTSQNATGTIVAGTPKTASFTNARRTGMLKIVKVDENNDPLSGIVFEAVHVASGEKFYLTTGANGETIAVQDMPTGAYVINEISAPAKYELKTGISATITENTLSTINVTNEVKTADIYIFKRNSDTSALIPGAEFTLYDANNNVVDVQTSKSANAINLNSNDIKDHVSLTFEDVPYGTYTIVETNVPVGYTASTTTYHVTVNGDTAAIPVESSDMFGSTYNGATVFTVTNDPVPNGRLVIVKNDENNDPLPGATFLLEGTALDGTTISQTYISGNNGQIVVDPIPYGAYSLVEVSAPTNYIRGSSTPVNFVINGNTPQVTQAFTNARGTGTLNVTKTVTGANPNADSFSFTVTLDDNTYNDSDFTNGVATFNLSNGQNKSFTLPAGVGYTVVEQTNPAYSTTSTGATGTIAMNQTSTAAFTNARGMTYHDVTLIKLVKGNLGDLTKNFSFTITFAHLEPSTTYSLSNGTRFTSDASGNASVTDTLRGRESFVIKNLPANATYQITEAASDHVASYTVTDNNNGNSIVSTSDANIASSTQLATATETVDASEDIVVTFTNTRTLETITGAIKASLGWVALMLALLTFGVFVLIISFVKSRKKFIKIP